MATLSKPPATIERLYALNAGIAVAPDRSVYSPGRGEGEQVALRCNAYLTRHEGRWLLWDTGIPDPIAALPGGEVIAHGIRAIVTRTIESQLDDIGLAARDIDVVVLSRAHFDHVGNAALFAGAIWYVQRREHDAMFGPDHERCGYVPDLYECPKQASVTLMDGDCDLFGDGAVRVVSTPDTPRVTAQCWF